MSENTPKPNKSESKSKSNAKSLKTNSLSKYLKLYNGNFQDYENSRGIEVLYPTRDIKSILKEAYADKKLDEIVESVGYNKEETATIIYDHFINRTNINSPKIYKYEDEVMSIINELTSKNNKLNGGKRNKTRKCRKSRKNNRK